MPRAASTISITASMSDAKTLRIFIKYLLFKIKTADNRAIISRFEYPERDLNPHSRNGQRILSPSCLPFHHPGSLPCAEGAGGKAQQSYANF